MLAAASLLAALSAAPAGASAPGQRLWVRSHPGTCEGLAKGPGGSIYAVGGRGRALLLVKYGPSGVRRWTRTFRHGFDSVGGRCVAVDGRGNVFVAGTVRRKANDDVILLKYSATGARRWFRLSKDKRQDRPFALAIGSDGNVCVGAITRAGALDDDSPPEIAISEYDRSGHRLWVSHYGPPDRYGIGHQPYGLALDGQDDVYVAAVAPGAGFPFRALTLKFSGQNGALLAGDLYDSGRNSYAYAIAARGSTIAVAGAVELAGSRRILVVTYDPSLTRRYAVEVGDPVLFARASGVALDGQGDAYIAGLGSGNTDSATGGSPYLTLKLDAAGALIWRQAAVPGGDKLSARIVIDQSGNSYIAGTADTSVAGGRSDFDFFVLGNDSSGSRQWLRTWSSAGRNDWLRATALARGSLYVGGESYRVGGSRGVVIRYAR